MAAHQDPHPWDSPGKNIGVGFHFLLQCMKVKSESEVAQLCLTLTNPMDYRLPGSSVHGICQARVLEWAASAFSIWVYTQWQFIKNPIKYKRGGRLQTKGTPCRTPVHNTEKKGGVLEVMSIFHPASLRASVWSLVHSQSPMHLAFWRNIPLFQTGHPYKAEIWYIIPALSSVFLSPVGD